MYTHAYVSECMCGCLHIYAHVIMCVSDGEGSRVFVKVIVASNGLSNIQHMTFG